MNLKELLGGDLNRMRYVTRYSSIFVLHKESVAEHSYYVSLYALIIARELRARGEQVNIESVLMRAIVHDIEECRTGDIFRPFKYANDELKKMIDEQAKKEIEGVFKKLNLSTSVVGILEYHWEEAKGDCIEGCIIAFCDFLSVLSYMLQEINCSNQTMLGQHSTMMAYVALFHDPKFDFIRELVQSATDITMDNLGNASGIKRL